LTKAIDTCKLRVLAEEDLSEMACAESADCRHRIGDSNTPQGQPDKTTDFGELGVRAEVYFSERVTIPEGILLDIDYGARNVKIWNKCVVETTELLKT
jgi:hypothetical protein